MNERPLHVLPAGSILHDRYVIGEVLGEGGFGITYAATENLLNMKRAIKEYFPHGFVTRNSIYESSLSVCQTEHEGYYTREKEKFLEEARRLAKFEKEKGIVSVTDFFEENNTAYIVMEYLDGITLKDYLVQNGVLPVEDVLSIMEPLLNILNSVHREGLMHRDISPDNIMLCADGDVKLMDFGAARSFTDYGEKSKSVVLKHGFAPYEQYISTGDQGPWTDIYAFCATIYKCITGRTPVEAISRIQEDTLLWPSQLGVPIPPDIEMALMKGLAVHRQDRYQSVAELYVALYPHSRDIAAFGEAGGYDWTRPYDNQVPVYEPTVPPGPRSQDMRPTGPRSTDRGGWTDRSYDQVPSQPSQPSRTDTGLNIALIVLLTVTVMLCIAGVFLAINTLGSGRSNRDKDKGKAKVETQADTGPGTATTAAEEAATEAATTEAATTEEEWASTEPEEPASTEEAWADTEPEESSVSRDLPYTDNEYYDLGSCLEPSAFATASCDNGSFSFQYPKYLFNQSRADQGANDFSLSYTDDNGNVPYELYVYEEDHPGSAEDSAWELYNEYKSRMYKKALADYPPKLKEGKNMARGSVGGGLDSSGDSSAYFIYANDGKKNYRLEFYYTGDPDVNNEYDDIDYVVECIYRGCSFSTSTYKLRTYQQFLTDDMGEKK